MLAVRDFATGVAYTVDNKWSTSRRESKTESMGAPPHTENARSLMNIKHPVERRKYVM